MPTSPEELENPKLNKLKEKWEAGDFAIDKDSVYGVDEAIESAGKQLSASKQLSADPDTITTETGTYGVFEWGETEDPFGPILGAPGDAFTRQHMKDLANRIDSEFVSKDLPPHHKMCRFCERTSRNEHCSECYEMIRSAAENLPLDRMLTKQDTHPCLICEEGDIMTAICVNCMNALLE